MGESRWREVALGEVVDLPSGKTRIPEGAESAPVLTFKGLRPSGVKDFGEVVSLADATEGGMTYLQPGDVVGTNQGHASGWILKKVGFISAQESPAFAASTLQVFRPIQDLIDSRYLYHYLVWPVCYQKVAEMAGPRNSFTAKMFKDVPVPLPPIEEQRRIASILDATDALRVKRREALEKLDSLTQSIFIDMFGDPKTNPRGLTVRPIGELMKLSSGNGLSAKDMRPGPYPVYGGNGVSGMHDHFKFEEPQIVIGRVGVYCGCVHVTAPMSWVTDNALFVHGVDPSLNRTYLAAALREANLNQYASQAAQPLISGSRVYPVPILLPPIEEQLDFERAVEANAAVRKRMNLSEESVESLFASLEHRAFRGEL